MKPIDGGRCPNCVTRTAHPVLDLGNAVFLGYACNSPKHPDQEQVFEDECTGRDSRDCPYKGGK